MRASATTPRAFSRETTARESALQNSTRRRRSGAQTKARSVQDRAPTHTASIKGMEFLHTHPHMRAHNALGHYQHHAAAPLGTSNNVNVAIERIIISTSTPPSSQPASSHTTPAHNYVGSILCYNYMFSTVWQCGCGALTRARDVEQPSSGF